MKLDIIHRAFRKIKTTFTIENTGHKMSPICYGEILIIAKRCII